MHRFPFRISTFPCFNKMKLNGVLVKDQKGDTLLYSGQVRVNITDWFFFKDKIELKYIGLTGYLCAFVPERFGVELSVPC